MTEAQIDALAARMGPIMKSALQERDLRIRVLEEKMKAIEREVFEKSNGSSAGAKSLAADLRRELAVQ